MSAEVLSIISLISYILAGICLVLAIFFWFFYKIPRVIGELSGRTAKKTIAKMRNANEKTGRKSYRPSATNVDRGKLTDAMTGTKPQARQSAPAQRSMAQRPEPAKEQATEALYTGNATEQLGYAAMDQAGSGATEQLGYAATEQLGSGATEQLGYAATEQLGYAATEQLNMADDDGSAATTLLRPNGADPMRTQPRTCGKLTMINEVMLIHTNEHIA